MDYSFFLILDAVILIIATFILTYFFIRDTIRGKRNKK